MNLILYYIVVLGLLIPAWKLGYIDLVLQSDRTFMSPFIFVLFLVGAYHTIRGHWDKALALSDGVLFLGLVGTALGFIIAMSGIEAAKIADLEYIQTLGANILAGMGTALYTTLIGSISAFFLKMAIIYFGPTTDV